MLEEAIRPHCALYPTHLKHPFLETDFFERVDERLSTIFICILYDNLLTKRYFINKRLCSLLYSKIITKNSRIDILALDIQINSRVLSTVTSYFFLSGFRDLTNWFHSKIDFGEFYSEVTVPKYQIWYEGRKNGERKTLLSVLTNERSQCQNMDVKAFCFFFFWDSNSPQSCLNYRYLTKTGPEFPFFPFKIIVFSFCQPHICLIIFLNVVILWTVLLL